MYSNVYQYYLWKISNTSDPKFTLKVPIQHG